MKFDPPDFQQLADGLDGTLDFTPRQTLDEILPAKRIHKRPACHRRQFFDYAKADLAAATLDGLPAAGETWHLVTGATYSPIDLLSAIIRQAGSPCRHLWIATLATNERSIAALADMRNKGQLEKITVLLSEFFRDADSDACQAALAGFRAIGATAHHAKCHAKVYLLDFVGTAITVEGSANLRTCRSVEQLPAGSSNRSRPKITRTRSPRPPNGLECRGRAPAKALDSPSRRRRVPSSGASQTRFSTRLEISEHTNKICPVWRTGRFHWRRTNSVPGGAIC